MAVELKGGFINSVTLRSDGSTQAVTKTYEGEERIGVPAHQRFRRESLALQRHHRHGIAPALLDHSTDQPTQTHTVTMEYIPHIPELDDHIRTVEPHHRHHILQEAGEVLRRVHQPVNVNHNTYLSRYLTKVAQTTEKAANILQGVGMDAKAIFDRVVNTIDPNEVASHGITYVHRDPWLNNFLFDGEHVRGLVDWELAGIGSPLEDLAIVDLWIAREHGDISSFWKGYGKTVDRRTLLGFVLGKCLSFLGNADSQTFQDEKRQGDGFYMNKIGIIQDILTEI